MWILLSIFIGLPLEFFTINIIPSTLNSDYQSLSAKIPATTVSRPKEDLATIYNRGNAYLISGRFAEALEEFNEAVSISPTTSDVYLSRGIVEEKLFLWNDAIRDYTTANTLIKNRPFSFSGDDATCFSNKANAETGLEKWDDALKDYTYAATLKPDFVAPQLGRALVLYQLDQKNEAIQYFKALTSTYPVFSDAQAALAVMLYERGSDSDIADSLERWETALEGDSRYLDVEWLRDIRRWPPRLVVAFETFKSFVSSQ